MGREKFNSFGQKIFDLVGQYTKFPAPVLTAQCKACGLNPAALEPADLDRLVGPVCHAVAQFTSPQKAALLEANLDALRARKAG
jgi:hypothetical protein